MKERNICSNLFGSPILGGPVVAPPSRPAVTDPLAPFSAPVRAWFESTFAAPTAAQSEGWAAISAGHHTLIHAPTGSGKTPPPFLRCLDALPPDPPPPPATA